MLFILCRFAFSFFVFFFFASGLSFSYDLPNQLRPVPKMTDGSRPSSSNLIPSCPYGSSLFFSMASTLLHREARFQFIMTNMGDSLFRKFSWPPPPLSPRCPPFPFPSSKRLVPWVRPWFKKFFFWQTINGIARGLPFVWPRVFPLVWTPF